MAEDIKTVDTAYPQRRLLYLAELDMAGREGYNRLLSFRIGMALNLERLSKAFNALIERHEMLRTTFHVENGRFVQRIHPPFRYEIKLAAVPGHSHAGSGGRRKVLAEDSLPLFSAVLEIGEDEEYYLCIDKPLLLADAMSDRVLMKDLEDLYAGKHLPDMTSSYADFVLFQDNFVRGEAAKDINKFWLNSFKNEVEALYFPPEIDDEDYRSEREFRIGGIQYSQFKRACERHNLHLPSFLLACFYVLLHRYSGSDVVVVASTFPGRKRVEFESVCGYFENMVPIKKNVDGEDQFYEFYESVDETYKLISDYQEVPFDAVVEQLRNFRSLNPDDLFNIGFHYVSCKSTGSMAHPFFSNDLLLTCSEADGSEVVIQLRCNPEKFSSSAMGRFLVYYRKILDSVLSEPETAISAIPVLPEGERRQLLQTFNAFEYDFGIKEGISRYFEASAKGFPNQIAVYHNSIGITYRTLNGMANQIASLLREKGVTKNTFVGFYGPRDTSLVVALMAILKAGGVYIPFDINNPFKRTKSLMNDSQTHFLVTSASLLSEQRDLFSALPSVENIFCLEEMGEKRAAVENDLDKFVYDASFFAGRCADDLPSTSGLEDWAYMLYTSGSTGEPKGAITRHNGALNHIFAEYRELRLDDGFNFLQSANISSDISVWQILAPLLKGGCAVIIDQDDLLNYGKLTRIIEDRAVSIVEFVPSFIRGWIDYLEGKKATLPSLPALKWIMMVGEEVPLELVNKWLELYPNVNVLNGYGPCEASDDIAQYPMTCKLDPGRKKVPIGRPLTNLNLFLFDKYGNLAPMGAIGEIGVSGVGVGAGYWNRPTNTTKSFILNPFVGTLGTTVYKTGDLGRWLSDGNLEFWGRIDSQVKIRGFRVEIGEIEAILNNHPTIAEAVVAVKEGATGEKELLAFLALKSKQAGNANSKRLKNELHGLCRDSLPAYMIPAQFVVVDNIYLNLSSKIDRRKLLEIAGDSLPEEEYTGPSNKIEHELTEIWKVVLSRDRVSVHDNFFMIGGHSLKATQIMSKVFKVWEVNLRLIEIFNNPTIARLATLIAGATKERLAEIEPTEEQDYYSLSHAQQRLWIQDNMNDQDTSYVISSCYQLEGDVEPAAFDEVFTMLLDRHESLRTCFVFRSGKPVQKILDPADTRFKVQHLDLRNAKERIERARELAVMELISPFDLGEAPLLRVKLIRLEEDRWIFLLSMHHIISDGWSTEVLYNEFYILYDAIQRQVINPLARLKLQYRDFVKWHNSLDFSEEERFWLQKLSGDQRLIDLPYDSAGMPKGGRRKGGTLVSARLESGLLQHLKALAVENSTSLSNVFFAVFNILLFNISGQKELPVGVAVANRSHPDTESLIGFFVNVMVILTRFNEDVPFADFLRQIADSMTEAYDRQNYPFDMLVNRINPSRDNGGQSLFNVMYAFQNYADLSLTASLSDEDNARDVPVFEHFKIELLENEWNTSKFDLTLYVFDHGESVHLSFEYNQRVFEEATIRNILDSFIEFLQYTANPQMAESY